MCDPYKDKDAREEMERNTKFRRRAVYEKIRDALLGEGVCVQNQGLSQYYTMRNPDSGMCIEVCEQKPLNGMLSYIIKSSDHDSDFKPKTYHESPRGFDMERLIERFCEAVDGEKEAFSARMFAREVVAGFMEELNGVKRDRRYSKHGKLGLYFDYTPQGVKMKISFKMSLPKPGAAELVRQVNRVVEGFDFDAYDGDRQ